MHNKKQSLPVPLLKIISSKGTEPPFSGEYNDWTEPGTYLCRQCGLALFRAATKFHSGCGWPSFDAAISDAVTQIPDRDGHRTEILCARCKAHLGHVFIGENFTEKNTRHCVNAASLDFVPNQTITDSAEAIYAAGCFWGVQALFTKLPGVLKAEVGYTGSSFDAPTYETVCRGNTGLVEAVRVLYNPNQLTYEALTQYFFGIHDPEQANGQGPDIGSQYLSVIFVYTDNEKKIAENLIADLMRRNYRIATKICPVSIFWRAEQYHQNYYEKTGKTPYCHRYISKF